MQGSSQSSATRAGIEGCEGSGCVAWSGGRGCAREGPRGAEGACSRGVYALAVWRLCAEYRWYCAVLLAVLCCDVCAVVE